MLLVRVPNWLGDLVMSMQALSGLNALPGGTAFWAHRRVAGLLPVFFPDTPVMDKDESPPRGRFDSLLLLTDSFSSALAGFRAGIPERTGRTGQFRSALLTRRIRPPEGRSRHHSIDYEELASAVGARPGPVVIPRFDPAPPHIAVFPGAAYGSSKIWNGFPEAAIRLSQETGLGAVFYGSAGESSLIESMASGSGGVIEAAVGLPLPELCRRLSGASAALGNDSGGMHLTALLGVPSVVLFGSTSPEWTAPRGPSITIVRASGFDCSPCFEPTCRKGAEALCMESITVDEILDAARALPWRRP